MTKKEQLQANRTLAAFLDKKYIPVKHKTNDYGIIDGKNKYSYEECLSLCNMRNDNNSLELPPWQPAPETFSYTAELGNEEYEFHNSYDLLMEVREKIIGLKFKGVTPRIFIHNLGCEIHLPVQQPFFSINKPYWVAKENIHTKQALFEAFYDFVKWFNDGTKKR